MFDGNQSEEFKEGNMDTNFKIIKTFISLKLLLNLSDFSLIFIYKRISGTLKYFP